MKSDNLPTIKDLREIAPGITYRCGRRRLRQNQFGNWYGYEGSRKVYYGDFFPEDMLAWLKGEK